MDWFFASICVKETGAPTPGSFLAAIEHPLDPVARFHRGSGARVERLNWAADLPPKGLKQSYGLMVNYLYDPRRLAKHRAMLAGESHGGHRDSGFV